MKANMPYMDGLKDDERGNWGEIHWCFLFFQFSNVLLLKGKGAEEVRQSHPPNHSRWTRIEVKKIKSLEHLYIKIPMYIPWDWNIYQPLL